MTMGKCGLGKTLAASAIAVLLAKKGFEVELTTTDPAAHIQDYVNQLQGLPKNLTATSKILTSRIASSTIELEPF